MIEIKIDVETAKALSHGLSDVLCWLRGWKANASEDQLSSAPFGEEELRSLNILLKQAIGKSEK